MASMTQRTCLNCGTKFMARNADIKRGWGKFCNKRCKAIKQEQRTGQFRRLTQKQEEESDSIHPPDYLHPLEDDNFNGEW